MAKPAFDPNQPFEPAGKAAFDASQPFDTETSAPPDKTSRLEAAASALSQAPFGFGDELGALGQASAGTMQKYESPQDMGRAFMDTYRQARGENRQIDEAAAEEHPGIYYPTLLAGGVLSSLGGDASAGPRTLGALVKAGAKSGLKLGAVAGLGGGNADLTKGELLKALLQSGVGSVAGGALGSILPIVGKGASALYRGVIKPSDAASLLRSKNVPLSLGQMQPEGIMANLEEAGQSSPIFGKALQRLRQAGNEGWQQAVVNEARAPGAGPVAGDPAEALAAAYEGYKPAYGAIRGQPISAGGLGQAMSAAAEDPAIYATPADVAAVQRFVGNQAGLIERAMPAATQVRAKAAGAPLKLVPSEEVAGKAAAGWQRPWQPSDTPPLGPLPGMPGAAGAIENTVIPAPTQLRTPVLGPLPQIRPPPEAAATSGARPALMGAAARAAEPLPSATQPRLSGPVDASAILEARSNIRAEIASRFRSGDDAGAKLLQNAEEALTARLESELPQGAGDALRATDAQYGRYKVVEDAVRRGGDQPGGFTPAQLSAAVRASAQKGQYARGAGGPLRDLAAAGRETLDQRTGQNGARLASMGTAWIPWLANTPLGKSLALGETLPQRGLTAAEDWAGRNGLLEALQAYMASRTGMGAAQMAEP